MIIQKKINLLKKNKSSFLEFVTKDERKDFNE